MEESISKIIELGISQGIWAALYIYLFFRMLKENKEREDRYQETEHYFRINGAQPYTDMEGMNLKLNAGDTGITIEDKQHNVMTFPAANGETPVVRMSYSLRMCI